MSKIFSCIFPFLSKSTQESIKIDDKDTAFISDSSSSSVCELSYHHVESVSKMKLQKRIQKLEKEREALVEMMISQHENYKNNVSFQVIQEKKEKKEKMNTTGNYYKKLRSKKQLPKFEESYSENTYDYITFQ
uniref:Uncharacterized protein n=1 Tax=Caenorhabditis tropicalis TaxID=1561998 RepID=A0A1I7TSA1_9PELO